MPIISFFALLIGITPMSILLGAITLLVAEASRWNLWAGYLVLLFGLVAIASFIGVVVWSSWKLATTVTKPKSIA